MLIGYLRNSDLDHMNSLILIHKTLIPVKRNTRKAIVIFTIIFLLGNAIAGTMEKNSAGTAKKVGKKISYENDSTLENLKITEIYPLPIGGEAQWVEIQNTGRSLISDIYFSLARRNEVLYSSSHYNLSLLPGHFVLVLLDGDEERIENDITLRGNRRTVFHSRPDTPNPLDEHDQCELWASFSNGQVKMIDFVAWGGSPTINTNIAEPSQLWHPEIWVDTMRLPRGGSLGRYPDIDTNRASDWVIYAPNEITPGSINGVPAPIWLSPQTGTKTKNRYLILGWTIIADCKIYHLQVSGKNDFSDLKIDHIVNSEVFQPKEAFSIGVHFCRVRAIATNNRKSQWSEIIYFTVKEE
jgi:hypothetical protein